MARVRGDHLTLDLLSWEPGEVVQRYDEQRVRTASLRAKIARAVSETLKDSAASREAIAAEMGAWLGEEVSVNMLNAYASEAREDHTIPYLRLLALVHVTGDVRLLQAGAEQVGHLVIESRYLEWVQVGMRAGRREEARRVAEEEEKAFAAELLAARRGWGVR